MKLVIIDQDLRIHDNPAIYYAIKQANIDNQDLIIIYILDEVNKRATGLAAKCFLHNLLKNLKIDIANKLSCSLFFYCGNSMEIINKIHNDINIKELFLNNSFEPKQNKLIEKISKYCFQENIKIHIKEANLLFASDAINNMSGSHFKVFTPFWRACLQKEEQISKPLPDIRLNNKISQKLLQYFNNYSHNIDNLKLIPQSNWHQKLLKYWVFKEDEILKNLENFIQLRITNYKKQRDFPAINATSKLSPYLHFGAISTRYIFNKVRNYQKIHNQIDNSDINHFLSEIGWREFSYNLLFNFKELPQKNFNAKFDKFPWYENKEILNKWQKGLTGYPIIDAGMRELWNTGWMHNRVRMIVGSFLVKDLLINWREGEKWFWDCLVDADIASNAASWQWISGSGADAAPYFRIFNPTLQSKKFDNDGNYIRKWLPELSKLSNKLIHEPSQANIFELKDANIELGKNYPAPIIDHKKARDMALMAFKSLS
jgi:deoxyribodipyrimidine photo-lyase